MFNLQPPRHISTLPNASVQLSRHVGFTPDSGAHVARFVVGVGLAWLPNREALQGSKCYELTGW